MVAALHPTGIATHPLAGAAPRPVYGVTVDRITGLPSMLAGLRALPRRPTVRAYFDVRRPASHYSRAVARTARTGQVMGELLDSSDERSISVAGVRARARSYVRVLGPRVAIWEVGNEVNGSWTGSPAVVSAKLVAAFDAVHVAGGKTGLTLYAHDFGPDHCGDGRGELTPLQFAWRWVPPAIARGLAYVWLSFTPPNAQPASPQRARLPRTSPGFTQASRMPRSASARWAFRER